MDYAYEGDFKNFRPQIWETCMRIFLKTPTKISAILNFQRSVGAINQNFHCRRLEKWWKWSGVILMDYL